MSDRCKEDTRSSMSSTQFAAFDVRRIAVASRAAAILIIFQ